MMFIIYLVLAILEQSSLLLSSSVCSILLSVNSIGSLILPKFPINPIMEMYLEKKGSFKGITMLTWIIEGFDSFTHILSAISLEMPAIIKTCNIMHT